MTNYEVIRRLTPNQMVDFLTRWQIGDIDYSKTFCDLCEGQLDCDEDCKKWWLTEIDAYEHPQGLQHFEQNRYELASATSDVIGKPVWKIRVEYIKDHVREKWERKNRYRSFMPDNVCGLRKALSSIPGAKILIEQRPCTKTDSYRLGHWAFLTKEEAIAKLKEMGVEYDD